MFIWSLSNRGVNSLPLRMLKKCCPVFCRTCVSPMSLQALRLFLGNSMLSWRVRCFWCVFFCLEDELQADILNYEKHTPKRMHFNILDRMPLRCLNTFGSFCQGYNQQIECRLLVSLIPWATWYLHYSMYKLQTLFQDQHILSRSSSVFIYVT